MPIIGYWPGAVALGIFFQVLIRRWRVLNIFLFPVSTEKLIGNSITIGIALGIVVRSSPILSFPLYYWSRNLFSTNRRSATNKNKSVKTSNWRCEFAALCLLALRRCLASPLSAGKNVAPITILYSPITVGATLVVVLHLFFQNSPIN